MRKWDEGPRGLVKGNRDPHMGSLFPNRGPHGKGELTSSIGRRVDRKLHMFSQRRLGINLIQTESKGGIVITRASFSGSEFEGRVEVT
jgi:hypothetical protein